MKFLPLLQLLAGLMLSMSAASAADSRPNILFFITDDESWLERSAYGWSSLSTPAFDSVARQGVLFTNGFTSAPSCAPSRACVLTGRNFWELKQGAFIQAFIPDEFSAFPKLLANDGYQIGRTGKAWGPGSRPPGIEDKSPVPWFSNRQIKERPKFISHLDYAANFDDFLNQRDPDHPFFFWAGTGEPHSPYDKDNYKRLEKEFGMTLGQVSLPPFMEDTLENRKQRANFLYEICYADRHLGRMLDSLRQADILKNTLVVVTSDNGTGLSHTGKSVGKASPYDAGVHEPLAMMWPSRVKPGRKVTDFVNFADFAPTFLEAAGSKVPASMSGRSLLPILESPSSGRIEKDRDVIVTGLEWHGEFDPDTRSSRSIRDDRYAYVVRYANVDSQGMTLGNRALILPSQIEFYDLQSDPWQLKDLVDDPTVSADKDRLAARLRGVGLETGDPRITGEMDLFHKTRQYVQKRKKTGYGETLELPFE